MPKILSRSGADLADIYNVEGSIAGIEDLVSREVHLAHEMGAEIFSERLRTFMVLLDTGNVIQNTAFNEIAGGIPDSINRVLGVSVILDTAARLDMCSLMVRNTITGRETPIFVWDTADDLEQRIRWSIDGAAVVEDVHCQPLTSSMLPYLLTRTGASSSMPELAFRGLTGGFGAGNLRARCIVTLCRPSSGAPTAGEPSSHGLSIPGW